MIKTNYNKNLAFEEIEKSVGTFTITAEIREDKETILLFNHIPNLIAFLCTLKIGGLIIGEGRGASVLTKINKYVEKSVNFAWNASLIDAVVRSTKTLDSLYLKATSQKESLEEEPDLEKRDSRAFYGNEDMPRYASSAQKILLKKLLNSKCNEITKKEIEQKIGSPYFSSYEASQIIKNLLTK